jgi:hypothetical protein
MSTFNQLQQNRRIVGDFASTALAGISNPFARLSFMAALKKLGGDLYQHSELVAIYGTDAMRQALASYHEELFERILESPWVVQEEELKAYLSLTPSGLGAAAVEWRRSEKYQDLLPSGSPDYLRELFCSNMRGMLELFVQEAAA